MRVSVKTIHQFGIDVMKAAGLDDYEAEHLSHSLILRISEVWEAMVSAGYRPMLNV